MKFYLFLKTFHLPLLTIQALIYIELSIWRTLIGLTVIFSASYWWKQTVLETQQSQSMTEHFHNFQTFMPANNINLLGTQKASKRHVKFILIWCLSIMISIFQTPEHDQPSVPGIFHNSGTLLDRDSKITNHQGLKDGIKWLILLSPQ